MRHLPPLSAVRVFECAARHENFTTAAAELGMSQAAVSYQIRQLEDRLGVPLFRRERRRVLLTEAGRRAALAASRAFDALDAAFAELRSEDESLLTISAPQTFANEWLAWRLGGFQMAHPGTAVRLLVEDSLVDFSSQQVDVAIRGGFGRWPGLSSDHLITIDVTPMASPALLRKHGRPTIDRLLELPLLSPDNAEWPLWLAKAGIPLPPGPLRRGVSMASQANDGTAAMAGQGVAVLTPFFWRIALAERRLVRLFDMVASDGRGYWLVTPEQRRNVPKIKRFREWLTAEVARQVERDAGR
jgi:LysR family transcriptional regulator, glycine cleavage system transcriptional activator